MPAIYILFFIFWEKKKKDKNKVKIKMKNFNLPDLFIYLLVNRIYFISGGFIYLFIKKYWIFFHFIFYSLNRNKFKFLSLYNVCKVKYFQKQVNYFYFQSFFDVLHGFINIFFFPFFFLSA